MQCPHKIYWNTVKLICLYIVWSTESKTVATEIVWPTKPTLFTMLSFTGKA